jgi:hypothetical protein
VRRIVAVLVGGLLVVGAGCGGSDDSAASSDTTTASASAPARSESEARLLALADIQTTDALDARWEVRDVTEGVDIVLPPCIDEDATATDSSASIKLTTVNDLHLPSLEEQVTGYAGDGAAAAFDAAVDRLDGCDPRFSYQGTPSQGTIAPLDLGVSLGDESKAWRTTVTIAGAEVSVTTIQIRKGDFVASLVHTDITEPDTSVIAGFATKAAAKM